jgi:hypothetical protein
MYLLEPDVEFLNDWLNAEEEIAFLVSNGPGHWIAKKEHAILPDIGTQTIGRGLYSNIPPEMAAEIKIPGFVEYALWHIPSGRLPLLTDGPVKLKFKKEDWETKDTVGDPWRGWKELRSGANPRVPYFGDTTSVLHLKIQLPLAEVISMSGFGWIGNYNSIIGNRAVPSTEKFWSRLRRMAKKVAVHIPRANRNDIKKEIYAFPSAYSAIRSGRLCAIDP